MPRPDRVTMQPGGITSTQLQMLKMMAQGKDQYEMAKALELKPGTVHTYRALLLKKMGASNSTHAVAIAYERGWLKGVVPLPRAA